MHVWFGPVFIYSNYDLTQFDSVFVCVCVFLYTRFIGSVIDDCMGLMMAVKSKRT